MSDRSPIEAGPAPWRSDFLLAALTASQASKSGSSAKASQLAEVPASLTRKPSPIAR